MVPADNKPSQQLKTRLAGLDKLKYLMSNSSKKNIVQGMFNSVLCYCLPLFGGCKQSEVEILQVQQNRAAQTNRDLMYDRLNWLTVQQLIVYHTLQDQAVQGARALVC